MSETIKDFLVAFGFKGDEGSAKKTVDLARKVENDITKATDEGAATRVATETRATGKRMSLVQAFSNIFLGMERDRAAKADQIRKDEAGKDEKLQQDRERRAKERRAVALRELQANATRMAAFALKAVGAIEATALGIVLATDRAAKGFEKLNYAAQRTGAAPGKITAFGYAAGQLGSSPEAGQASLENLGQRLRTNPTGYATALKSIGVEARGANGELRDTADIAADLGQALARVRERGGQFGYARANAFANMFGMDEQTMRAAMDPRFRERMAERQEIDRRTGADQGAAAAGGTAFEQSMRRLEAMAESIRTKVSTNLFVTLTPELDKLAKWADEHGEQIGNVIDRVVKDIIALANAVTDQLAKVDWDGVLTSIENFGKTFDATTKKYFGENGPIIATMAVFGALIGSKVLGPLNLMLGTLRTIGGLPLVGRLLGGTAGVIALGATAEATPGKGVSSDPAERANEAAENKRLTDEANKKQGYTGSFWQDAKTYMLRKLGLGGDGDPKSKKVEDAIIATAEATKKLADNGGVGGGGLTSFGHPADTGVSGRGGANLRYGRDASGYRRGGHGGGGRNYADTPDGRGRAGAVNGSEGDRAMQAMKYLVEQKGYTPEGAAIAVGNAMQESGVLPNGKPGDPNTPGGSHYMFQWNNGRNNDTVNGRRARYEKWARENGRDLNDYRTPLDFFDLERRQRSGLEGQWHQQRDLKNAGRLGHLFEGYGDNSEGTRVQNARNLMEAWKRAHSATAMAPAPAGTSAQAISDAEVFAARQRLASGGNSQKDRDLVERYRQQQNTPDDKQHLRNLQLVMRARKGHVLPYLHPHSSLSAAARQSIDNSRRNVSMVHSPTFNIHGGDANSMLADAHRLAGRGQADMVRNLNVAEA